MNHAERHAAVLGDRAAIRFNGTTATWVQLRDRIHRLARGFSSRGVGFGDRVALVAGNRPEFVEIILAANLLGAIAVPINFRLTGPEVAYILADSGAKIVVGDELGTPIVAAAVQEFDEGPWVITTGVDGTERPTSIGERHQKCPLAEYPAQQRRYHRTRSPRTGPGSRTDRRGRRRGTAGTDLATRLRRAVGHPCLRPLHESRRFVAHVGLPLDLEATHRSPTRPECRCGRVDCRQ
ncbi:AMP-binding protein [Nocardia sp. NPDC050408]|uniref:AMP-binding protein n=1 Tax=Nocardia sp. NPDC050408 TaxID=3364319 RepID=UPI00378FB7C9